MSNAKKFPTCDGNKISAMKTDSFCPKKALIATGPVNAILGDNTLNGAGLAVQPVPARLERRGRQAVVLLHHRRPSTSVPRALHTGDTNAYPGFVKQQGKNQVTDVPLPPFVSTKVAGVPNFYGSLIKEVLTFKKGFNSSVACKGGKRPYSVAFTAVGPSGKQTKTSRAHCRNPPLSP